MLRVAEIKGDSGNGLLVRGWMSAQSVHWFAFAWTPLHAMMPLMGKTLEKAIAEWPISREDRN
jgi:hypothetical protein